jgi:translation initiation factor 3 subunit J
MLQQRLCEDAERKAEESERSEELTTEELLSEKLHQQKLQEESDLRVAMETFGVSHSFIHHCFLI